MGRSTVQARARSATGVLSAVQTLSGSGTLTSNPEVGVDANGNAVFAFAWTRLGDRSRLAVRARSATGALSRVQYVSDPGRHASDPELAVDPSGNAVFAWTTTIWSSYPTGENTRIQARARSATGALSAVRILSASGQDASSPRVGVDAIGNAVFAWTRFGGANFRVQTRTRSAAGVLGAVQNVSESGQDAFEPQLAVGAGGDAATSWTRGRGPGKAIKAAVGP